jgi:hypothetical protein
MLATTAIKYSGNGPGKSKVHSVITTSAAPRRAKGMNQNTVTDSKKEELTY